MMAKPLKTLELHVIHDPVFNNMDYSTCHLYFVGIHAHLKTRLYAEKIQVTRGIFYGIPLESVS